MAAAAAGAVPPDRRAVPSHPCRAAGWRASALPTPTGCWWGRRLRLLGQWPNLPA
jgi:hypothetical protein